MAVASWKHLWDKRKTWALLSLPSLLSGVVLLSVIFLAQIQFAEGAFEGFSSLPFVIAGLAVCLLAFLLLFQVHAARFVVLGEKPLLFSKKLFPVYCRYTLYFLGIGLFLLPAFIALGFLLLFPGIGTPVLQGVLIALMLVLLFLSYRIQLALTAAAVQDPSPLKTSWRITKGRLFRLWWGYCLATAPLVCLDRLMDSKLLIGEDKLFLMSALASLDVILYLLVGAVFCNLSYAQLSGKKD
jgi:hypothetical protein